MSNRCINFSFHGLGEPLRPVTDNIEARQWSPIAEFESILDTVRHRRNVRISFDDGFASDISVALPRLLDRNLTADFFISTGRLGRPGYIDIEGLRTLDAAGMNIGCHGIDHLRWREVSAEALHREVSAARRILEEILGHPVHDVAIPFGQYDRRVLNALRQEGYRRVYTTDQMPAASSDAWFQPRYTAWKGMSPRQLRVILDGEHFGSRIVKHAKILIKRLRASPAPAVVANCFPWLWIVVDSIP